MYISDTDKTCLLVKTGLIYLFISMFCALFGAIYEYFSHEVYSYFMIYAFVFPLAGGVLPFLGLTLGKKSFPTKLTYNLYNSGIASLTLGSVCQGILDIYGTSNRLICVYWIMGVLFCLSGIICYLIQKQKKQTETAITSPKP